MGGGGLNWLKTFFAVKVENKIKINSMQHALNIFKSPQINDSQLSSEKNLNIMSPTSYSIMHGYDDNASWSLVGDSETSVQLGH